MSVESASYLMALQLAGLGLGSSQSVLLVQVAAQFGLICVVVRSTLENTLWRRERSYSN